MKDEDNSVNKELYSLLSNLFPLTLLMNIASVVFVVET